MDRSWIHKRRSSIEYQKGVDEFLDFAFRNSSREGKILCPCVHCVNRYLQTYEKTKEHLICDGFLSGYTRWFCHGESSCMTGSISPASFVDTSHSNGAQHANESTRGQQNPNRSINMAELLRDALGLVGQENNEGSLEPNEDNTPNEGIYVEQPQVDHIGECSEFLKSLEDVNKELYPGCKTFSKLSFILNLYHLKCLNGWTGKSFGMLLELLIDAFPEGNLLPRSFYEAKKIIMALGLNYEKIHACKNDCMLFWNENSEEEQCHTCGSSRWIVTAEGNNSQKKKPVKVLHYFPLIPRLQRLFISKKTSNDMRWHAEGRKNDGMLRHPADGEAWKAFDAQFPEFASDPHNVRLALSSDGFNPFRTMSTSYNTWPVVLIPYNMSPWTCMKQTSFILSTIIPGEKGPGNDIDVYLQPLIKELMQL